MRAVPVPTELLELALAVVRPAAALAATMRRDGVSGVSTKTTDTDVVTAADRAVERQVIDALRSYRPDDAVLGEESGGDGGGPVRWILDPIDGTVNYLYDLPVYAVSLAAEVDGTVVAGVVRNAATGREWTAVRGGGAYRDGRRLTGSTVTDLAQALLATGFGYDPARRAYQARVLAELLPRVRDVRRFGAAALDLAWVAAGRVDAYWERGLSPWDMAAGIVLVREAGGYVTDLDGGEAMLTSGGIVAGNDAIHRELLTVVQGARKM